MSDKGFGDHINRGVVKNPLLSTAVTGLSIEDLTHNTVLLPAVPSQELITRQDKQYEQPATQTATLANTNQTISNFPSGDANSNTIQPNIFTNVDFNTSQIKKDSQNNEIKEILASSTQSKASVKSDDDFDVNEYFARLQGSRYVSAPLSSIIKEDQNANLQAVEENLEEINLNEPDKVWEGTQQSLTADIAQNFSQLPTVLPQVASAVFSSFSNMLSLKSRDTPDVGNVYRPEETVPLGVPDAQKSVAPPPLKEPPPVGTSNYRITTKKKVYAQIPGLTGEAQINPYNPPHQTSGIPTSTSAPQNIYNPQTDHGAQLPGYAADGQNISFNTSALPVSQAPYFVSESFTSSIESSAQNSSTEKKESVYNFFTPLPETKSSHELQHQHETFPSKTGSSVPHTVQTTPQIHDTFQPDSSMTFMPIPSSTATIIPPPPMFSNVPRSDSQGSVGRTVLPPSVARRISAKQPVIRSQAPPMSMQGNIFVPTFTDAYQGQMNTSINQSETQVIQGNVPQFFDVPATNINSSSDFMLSQSTTSIGGIETSVPTVGPTFDMHTDTKSSFAPSQPIKHPEMDIFMQENIHVTQNTRPEMTNIQQTSNLSHPQSIYSEPKTVHPESATPESQKALSMTSQPESPFFSHPMPPVSSSIQPPKASEPIALELQSSTSSDEQSIDLVEKSLSVLNEPSPLFYDPTSMTQQKSHIEKTLPQVFAPVNIDQYFIQNSPPSEPLKTVIEPPKITGNLNLRMTKKRPQYYSGPIEGVGSISNNIKPTLNPVPYDTFQGALFTPSQEIPQNVTEAQNITPNIDAPTLFDSSNVVPPYSHPSLPREEYQTHYNTVFDLSRPTTEKYEQAQPEPEPAKGFGLLGSLKSKLSSLDINKIQNTVTTFFDPAYNEAKEEHTLKQESSYPNQTYGNEYSKDSATFDIFVGDYNRMQPASSYPTNYNSTEFQHANVNVQESLPEKQSMMDIAWRDNSSVFVDQSDIHHPSYSQANLNSIGSTIGSGIAAFKNTSVVPPFKNDYNNYATFNYSNVSTTILENTTSNMAENLVDKSNTTSVCSVPNINNPLSLFSAPFVSTESLSTSLDDKIVESVTNLVLNSSPSPKDTKSASRLELIEKPISEPVTLPPIENTFKLFDSHPLLPSDENVVSETTFIIKDDIESEYEIRTQNIFDSFENSPIPDLQSSSVENNFNVLHSKTISNVTQNPSKEVKGDDTLFKYFEKPTAGETTHLFDFSNHSTSTIPSTVSAFDELSGIENKHESMVLHEPQSHILSESTQAFANVDEELAENVSELNICVTCREVAKPEEKEAEDLTTQLIENIVAPIQLLNPVGAALAESEQGQEISKIATIDPLSEISHSTEEVINDVPIHSVTELLSDVNIDDTVPNYGWNTSDINDILNTNTLVEHDYSLQPDPSAIGFLQNKSLFFENIPTNASDEIKAEFKNSHEDPEIIPRHIEIPTAPPDEDSKSDESGLDVLSIEQDAKKDFPIYDEFVIEPSETDDDKIECMERENNTEEFIPEVDTFTNRVERFKLMETVDNDEVFESQVMITTSLSIHSPTSPAITIASYFDTGNYAVENHYRNSLTSPTALNSLTSLTTSSMRIPPGFEKEYQRRLSGISSDILPDSSYNNVKYVPDTSTQTTSSTTITYSQSPVNQGDITHVVTAEIKPSAVIETILTKPIQEPITADVERLPAFSSLTGQSKETIENKDEENDANLNNLPKAEAKTLPDPMNFFTSDAGTSDKEEYNNYSRLSSYFASPPKSDNAKSFFELSQSQNHYRHASIENEVRNSLDTKNNDTHKDLGITQTRYNETMNLIRDLANYRDLSPNDDIVRTVNYFTVELDIHKSNDSIGEPSASVKITDKDVNRIENNNTRNDNLSNEDVVRKCKNCCNLNTGRVIKLDLECVDCKFRKCMDSGEDGKGEINMDAKSEGHKQTVTVNFMEHTLREGADDGVAILSENRGSSEYSPVKYHWFYRVDKDGNSTWRGFSVADSRALENAFTSSELTDQTVVPTDGGRYDVNVYGRLRMPVYWNEKPTNVRRCSWFYKGNTDARYVPYTEPVAEKLEEEYRHGVTTGEWHRRLVLPNNELVVMHGPAVMVHFLQTMDSFSSSPLFAFGKTVYRNPPKIRVTGDQTRKIDHLVFLVHGAGEYRHQKEKPQSATRPRVVRRGCVESEIEDTEPSRVDHLLLLCHGVGSACDMRMRALEAVVNDFRSTSLQLLQSHYRNSYDSGLVGRIEVLPISWHSRLHSNETGVDRRLANVTLESIPWLRGFTNDTILDVLFYTSPVYCQTIIDTVCSEMNRIYGVFRQRNPDFKGGVSLGGHSLGSVILYDLLGHQLPAAQSKGSTDKTYVQGYTGKGQPTVQYPQLDFHPAMMFALGSPIAIFECIRGVELLGQGFSLPTCNNFFNIFHPYDPIAYRIEPMIDPGLKDVKPYLIPHHKGRKRMHLELKDTMARFGADIKQKLIESIKSTWSSVWKTQPPPSDQLEKVVEEEMEKEELTEESKTDTSEEKQATPEMLGTLNGGRRVDYVLQEAPFEMINEYLFAMTSHVCYWESEDTILLILREIYDSLKVQPDCSVPQQSMSVQRTRTVDHDGVIITGSTESPSTSRGAS